MLSVLAAQPGLAHAHPPRNLRIAVSTRSPVAGIRVDDELSGAVRAAARTLAHAGHHVEEADPPKPPLRLVIAIFAHWFGGAAEEAAGLDIRRLERRTRTCGSPRLRAVGISPAIPPRACLLDTTARACPCQYKSSDRAVARRSFCRSPGSSRSCNPGRATLRSSARSSATARTFRLKPEATSHRLCHGSQTLSRVTDCSRVTD